MYGGPVTGKTQHLESSIPLILIIILAIFIAGNFGFINFSDVPLLNQVFGGKIIKVGVVGRISPELKSTLITEEYRTAGIYYGTADGLRPDQLFGGVLKPFDVIILQGQQTCDRNARKTITDWVKGGGKLIVVGDACTRVTDDPAACGWDVGIGLLGDIMPAKICGVTPEKQPIETGCSSGQFKFLNPDHPIESGIKNFAFSGRTFSVFPTSNSNLVATIDCSDTGKVNSPATYAILESSGVLTGKVVYFSFDPGMTSRNMLLNTLKYLKNQRG